MKRVYLDHNIYTGIKNKRGEKFLKLDSVLKEHNSVFFTPYSDAHVDDLMSDPTNNKDSDLELIQGISSNYLMAYDFVNKKNKLLLATPLERLKSKADVQKSDNPITDALKAIEEIEDPEIQTALKPFIELFKLPVHNFAIDGKGLRPEDLEIISKIVPSIDSNFSLNDFAKNSQKLQTDLQDKSSFKKLRNYNRENLPNLNSLKDTKLATINDALKNSGLKKDLTELIDQSGNSETLNQKFISGFTLLNLFGLDKEKNKKADWNGLNNDTQHAFYGTYCDFLISEDEGMRIKSKILYENYGIQTVICTIDEFLEIYPSYISEEKLSIVDFVNRLKEDLTPDKVINRYDSARFNRTTELFYPSKDYFNYFNLIEFINDKDTGIAIVLRPKKQPPYSDLFYDEVKYITNYIVSSFGHDIQKKAEFTDADLEAIKKWDWDGRIWPLSDSYIILEVNKSTEQLCLAIFYREKQNNTPSTSIEV